MWEIEVGHEVEIIVEVSIAMLLGGIVGLEREFVRKPAGFRTHSLVSGTAALLTGLGNTMVVYFYRHSPSSILENDPIGIIQSIVIGVSFLGGGTIFRTQEDGGVEGLTTAASILIVAGIGIAVALDYILTAAATTLLALATLRILRRIENPIRKQKEQHTRSEEEK